MVEVIENGAGTGAEAIIVAPAAQKSIDPLEAVSQRAGERVPPRLLLDPIPKVRLLVLGNLDPRHESELVMPLQSDSMTEELEPLAQVSYPRLFRRQIQPRLLF
jgi:hypothetical protein